LASLFTEHSLPVRLLVEERLPAAGLGGAGDELVLGRQGGQALGVVVGLTKRGLPGRGTGKNRVTSRKLGGSFGRGSRGPADSHRTVPCMRMAAGDSFLTLPTSRPDRTPQLAVALYREWMLAPGQGGLLASARSDLAGKTLLCRCSPAAPCHADLLLEPLLDGLVSKHRLILAREGRQQVWDLVETLHLGSAFAKHDVCAPLCAVQRKADRAVGPEVTELGGARLA